MAQPTTMTPIYDWRDLPFAEIWVGDAEYYPGSGLNNGGVKGDPITPLCFVAHEMRSGRTVRFWQDQLGPVFPPLRLGTEAVFISFSLVAEFGGAFLPKGWREPACAIDAHVEFRHATNDGSLKSGDREKGFYSLAGALRYFLEDGIDIARKDTIRDRILLGPPFSDEERRETDLYCEDDTRGLAHLIPHLVPTIRSLPHALMRGKVQWVNAKIERRGIPIDRPKLAALRKHWSGMRIDLVRELDRPFGCYEIVDGEAHWRTELFAGLLRRRGMSWPALPSGALDLKDRTFREMAGLYPFIEPLRELRYSLSKLRLNDLEIGNDGRNRTPLWAYGTKTARNAPSTTKFMFGPAKWLRFLIKPPPGRALVHRDYCQQEPRIAAVQSGDRALLHACESGDLYFGVAQQLGFLRESLNDQERKAVRALFKTVVLGIQYGLGARSLAIRAGISLPEAGEILARLRARFHRFEDYCRSVLDHAGLHLELSTPFGWTMQCPSGMNPRTLRNFPIQSTGAEILHVACILAERRGLEIVAPVHDAVMAECDLDVIEDVSRALDRVMRDASAVVLRGYELPTDVQLIRPGGHYVDDRGQAMWNTVSKLLAGREQGVA
jgi:hypothetical protein